ncbi:hypothetical protein JOS77_10835 [Chromobacterium haemolyticum]|nr:hypothetical protein JOS77_10835 [Chromobacterium haemolyticum]
MKSFWSKTLAGLLAAAALAGCAQVNTTQGGAVGVSRGQTMLLSSQEVEQMSAKSYAPSSWARLAPPASSTPTRR